MRWSPIHDSSRYRNPFLCACQLFQSWCLKWNVLMLGKGCSSFSWQIVGRLVLSNNLNRHKYTRDIFRYCSWDWPNGHSKWLWSAVNGEVLLGKWEPYIFILQLLWSPDQEVRPSVLTVDLVAVSVERVASGVQVVPSSWCGTGLVQLGAVLGYQITYNICNFWTPSSCYSHSSYQSACIVCFTDFGNPSPLQSQHCRRYM